jgi:hypothetical protein
VADGYGYFSAAYAAYGSLSYDKTIPEAMIVGLDYAGDNLDYFSMRDDDLLPMMPLPSAGRSQSTGAAAFLAADRIAGDSAA